MCILLYIDIMFLRESVALYDNSTVHLNDNYYHYICSIYNGRYIYCIFLIMPSNMFSWHPTQGQ